MSLKESINEKLKAAMKAVNEDEKRVFRLILAAAKLAEVENRASLDDTALLNVIQKEIKIRREALESAEAGHREDLIALNKREITILEGLLPKQLTEQELSVLAQQTIDELGASNPADTGRVMKALLPKVQGRASGEQVSQIVRQLLQKSS